ncbi:MAG TPA: TatD family hydrolase [Kiritimatiellia bacterium]|nr:TatD family hydrolase [Kiritimatiellia bacterium]
MDYIEPHAHMVSRTTDDYQKLALAGCRALSEPAFWAGFDRSSADGFRDYFDQLTLHEPKRAAAYGILHTCWLCINPKEAEDLGLARDVMSLIPERLARPNVLGIGEIGLNKNSRNELAILEAHLSLAREHNQLVLIHTPHLEDKRKGTRLTLDALAASRLDPARVIIDHVEEHTIGMVLDAGYWAGMTLYPDSKCSIPRAVDMLEVFGPERIWMNSACDWGPSDPLSVPLAILEMQRRRFPRPLIHRIVFQNPHAFMSQSGRFTLDPS